MDDVVLPVLQTAALALARSLSRRNRPELALAALLELREPTGPIRVVTRPLRQEGPASIVPDLIGLFCPEINVDQHTLERHRARLRSPNLHSLEFVTPEGAQNKIVIGGRPAKDPTQFTILEIRRFLESLRTNS